MARVERGRQEIIGEVVQKWRESLINLTGRNRLLNFSVTRASTVPITVPDLDDVLERLQTGRRMKFAALKPPPAKADDDEYALIPEADPTPTWQDQSTKVQRDPQWLGANVDPAALSLALRNLMTRTNQTFMDTGLWTLYMSFGTLTWIDPADSKKYRSPLVLVPVSLQSPGPRLPAEVALGEEDVVVNPALALKMQALDLDIPRDIELDDPAALDSYLASLERLVARREGWSVGREAFLSYFTFHKEAMYRDLMDNIDLVVASEQVQALAMSGIDDESVSFAFEPITDAAIDDTEPPEEAFQVLDADASQRAAIAAAAAGRSFIVDGPPGTGKSQTITNIIASLIPQGKSVLFVSEKAAALEVVKNRLEEVGLGSYALELHSHKATRKEVAEELSNALLTRPKGPAPLSATELRRLKKARIDLSRYAAAMNQERDPLGISVHDAMGRVAMYEGLGPTRPCDGDLSAMSAGDLADIQDAAAELGRAWRPALQGEYFLWRDVTSHTSLAFELGDAIDAIDELGDIAAANDPVMQACGWDRPSDTQNLLDLVDLWHAKPSGAPLVWLQEPSLDPTRDAAGAATHLLTTLRDAEASAENLAGPNWLNLQVTPPSQSFVEVVGAIAELTPTAPGVNDLTIDAMGDAHAGLIDAHATFVAVTSASRDLAPKLGLLAPRHLEDVEALLEVEGLSRSANRPEGEWLKTTVDADVEEGLALLKKANADCQTTEAAAKKHFTDHVLDLDPQALNVRFENIHRGLHRLSSDYRRDVRALAEASVPGVKGKANITHLPTAVAWQQALASREELEHRFMPLIGPRYKQTTTNWTALEDALATARRIASAATNSVLESLMTAVGNGSTLDPLNASKAQEIRNLVVNLTKRLADARDTWMPDELRALTLADQQSWLTVAATAVADAQRLTSGVQAVNSAATTFDAAQQAREAVERAVAAATGFEAEETTLGSSLGSAFTGRTTDLDQLMACLQWTGNLRQLTVRTSRVTLKGGDALDAEQVKALESSLSSPALEPAVARYEAAVRAVCDAFTPDRGRDLGTQVDSWTEGPALLTEMRADSSGQDEWFSYQSAVSALAPWGLAGVVDSSASSRLAAPDVPFVVAREAMRRWVDQLLDREPILRDARSTDRDALAVEFRSLDKQLVATTVSRVIDRANTFRPSSTVGQAGIIVSEGRKKRRHMPIRELLAKTMDVTPGIKPIFMMSPLSVSQYLPPDLRFDVVIFDEASQVMPEDAVNCIYRGTSLIIAGDEKQLPPTNFFELATNDADETWEEDQSSAKDFESVLSIAKGCGAFTSLTLNWHYRSRHEALIAFSNNRFYGGDLITFPGAQAEGPDVGVESFLVENGVYDRGGSRRNMNEARFVAGRIAHHFDTRPGMSLGVVAFSQAQAESIQYAVDELTLERPHLEGQFGGSRLDVLFIKNLESVQGDERDVMIFSVGYGPDADGKLTMNFGPINRDGGWRRLNVAVTRARYRNEVVASFTASQMTHSTSRSVSEFRRYLDYAAHGVSALSLDDSLSLGDAESPFEESVLSWLRSEGYMVTSQVGSSGYRIDMAVHHPEHPSRFVLGIECDGVAYHSSKTARDRDRLREQVLTGLGWTLHRIWGTAWYRHRESEQQRLRDAIEAAISAPVRGLLPRGGSQTRAPSDLIEYEDVALGEIAEWAVPYRRTTPQRPPRHVSPSEPESVPHHVKIIESVVDHEGPVHRVVLEKRVREAWQVGRIGDSIRAQIIRAINRSHVELDGDFLLPPSMDGAFPTRAHDVDTKREIAHIYMGEIEETAYRVTRDARAIDVDALVVSTARHLGFARVGDDVRSGILQGIRNLQESGWISDDDDTRIRVLIVPEEVKVP